MAAQLREAVHAPTIPWRRRLFAKGILEDCGSFEKTKSFGSSLKTGSSIGAVR
jgi:hypothetical protein